MSIKVNSCDAMEHPDLLRFISLCDEVRKGGFMNRSLVQSRKLLPFSNQLIILQYDHNRQDFLYRYWGSGLTTVYGLELTNKYINDGEHDENTQLFIDNHLEVIQKKQPIYLSGTLDWRHKNYQSWAEACLPFEKDGTVNETLTYVTFN